MADINLDASSNADTSTEYSAPVVRGAQQPDLGLMQRCLAGMPNALQTLGFSALRPNQTKAVAVISSGCDVLLVSPTASGKTGCFVLPTLALGWHTIVFSPLIALMRDQVQNLSRRGIGVDQLTSANSDMENTMAMKRWMKGELSLLYVAPERLVNPLFQDAMNARHPDFVV